MLASSVRLCAFLIAVLCAFPLLGGEPFGNSQGSLVDGELPDFARRAFQVTQLVLDKHAEPPTRQEMLLCGLIAVHADHSPEGLSRAVSEVKTEDEFVQCLLRFWPTDSNGAGNTALRHDFLRGLGLAAPGGLEFQSAKDIAVQRQLDANRYVGIGITLQSANNAKIYQIGMTFPRGPAAKAGIKAGEYLIEVDGVKAEELSLEQVVDRLRGPEGTTVPLGVARKADGKPRAVTLTRSVVPRQMVVGCRQLEPEKWDPVVGAEVPVGYLRIGEIGGSTVAELREYEAELHARQVDSLILDLRGAHGRQLRHALALADALLDGGGAVGVRLRGGFKSAPLDRDCLFRDWPMAVLVTADTNGFAEWLAGLLQQRRGAIVVGQQTTGAWRFVLSSVELPDNWGVMTLATGVLEHENPPRNAAGRSLSTTVENAAAARRRIIGSHLSRLHPAVRKAADAPYVVTPDVHVESSHNESFSLLSPRQPDLTQSPFVASAIKALAKALGKASSGKQADSGKDQ